MGNYGEALCSRNSLTLSDKVEGNPRPSCLEHVWDFCGFAVGNLQEMHWGALITTEGDIFRLARLIASEPDLEVMPSTWRFMHKTDMEQLQVQNPERREPKKTSHSTLHQRPSLGFRV